MLPEYTILTIIGVIAVVLVELFLVRSGIFRKPAYWIALAICLGFQIPVDGYLTKLSNPIVIYTPGTNSGIRFPWDIPIEDFGFGFAMLTTVIMVWQALKNRRARAAEEAPAHAAQ
jgi:lycopene cyclase domain-containing protein